MTPRENNLLLFVSGVWNKETQDYFYYFFQAGLEVLTFSSTSNTKNQEARCLKRVHILEDGFFKN